MQFDRPVSMEAKWAFCPCDNATAGFPAGDVYIHLDDEGRARYDAAHKLIEDDNPYVRRDGFVQFLELMMENPAAMIAAVERLRATLQAVQIEPSEEELRRLYGG